MSITPVFVYRLKHIAEGLKCWEQLCNSAREEDDTDNFEYFIESSPVFDGEFSVNLHSGISTCGHTYSHDDKLAVFSWNADVLFVAVDVLLKEHIYQVWIVAHDSV